MNRTIRLQIEGLGIVFYSPFAVGHIVPGEDYLQRCFVRGEHVATQVNACQISAFCTGSPGTYVLRLYDGVLEEAALEAANVRARLGIEVRQGLLCFRDLYDFMRWDPECPIEQAVPFADGFHRITAYTSVPVSGVLGDDQVVCLHSEAWPQRPPLAWTGVPDLVPA